jgi:hypothetical protein
MMVNRKFVKAAGGATIWGDSSRPQSDHCGNVMSTEKWFVQLNPTKEALNDLGAAVRAQGDFTLAVDYFRKALALDSQYAVARMNLEQLPRATSPK